MGALSLRARLPDLTLGVEIQDWTGKLVENDGLIDVLQVDGQYPDVRYLFEDDAGNDAVTNAGVVLAEGATVRFSGVLREATVRGDNTATVTFESDTALLWDRVVYPAPTLVWGAQSGTGGLDYDTQTGTAETAALHYIDFSVGPSALTGRRVTGLTIPTSAGRGGTRTVKGRHDNVGRFVSDIGEATGLRFKVQQSGTALTIVVSAPPDLSATARYGTNDFGGPGLLDTDWAYTFKRPALNVALVAGGDEGALRKTRERVDAASVALWGRRVENVIDQRQTVVDAEMDKAGDDALLQAASPVLIEAPIPDLPELRLGVDVPMGALLTVSVNGRTFVDRLRQVTTVIGGSPGLIVSGVVGPPEAGLSRDQRKFLQLDKRLRKVEAR